MSILGESSQQNLGKGEFFDEQIDMLFEELSFAIHMERPSILLASYEEDYPRDMAELILAKRLAGIGQKLVPFPVDESHFDIPLILAQQPDREKSVFSVIGLSRGGGREDANAYRALNMRRELFVDCAMRVILWLTRDEAVALSIHAPDFWSFRHRTVDFDLLLETSDQTIRRLKHGLVVARKLNNNALLAQLWGYLGKMYLDEGQLNRSVRALRKAIRIDPLDAGLWIKLGYFYHVMKRYRDAIIAYQQVVLLDPRNDSVRGSLEDCYRSLGKDDQAEEQRRLMQSAMKNDTK